MIRIGLVDDDLEHLKRMREFLSRYGREEGAAFQVEEFHDGLSFVEDYNGQLDIAILDIEMPHMGDLLMRTNEGKFLADILFYPGQHSS